MTGRAQTERRIQVGFDGVLFLFMAGAFLTAAFSDWKFYSALMPMIFSGFGAVVSGYIFARDLRAFLKDQQFASTGPMESAEEGTVEMIPTMLIFFGWVAYFYISVLLIGFIPTIPMAVFIFMFFVGGSSWRKSLVTSVCLIALIYLVYQEIIHVPWYRPLFFDVF
jgi:hypothetical protein